MSHDATLYYVSFGTWVPLGSIVLDYTIYMNLTTASNLLGMFLTIQGSYTIRNSFSFDNGGAYKDYFGQQPYTVADNIAVFTESVLFRAPIAESLFLGGTANFNFCLSVVIVFGATISEEEATVSVTVFKTSGKYLY